MSLLLLILVLHLNFRDGYSIGDKPSDASILKHASECGTAADNPLVEELHWTRNTKSGPIQQRTVLSALAPLWKTTSTSLLNRNIMTLLSLRRSSFLSRLEAGLLNAAADGINSGKKYQQGYLFNF